MYMHEVQCNYDWEIKNQTMDLGTLTTGYRMLKHLRKNSYEICNLSIQIKCNNNVYLDWFWVKRQFSMVQLFYGDWVNCIMFGFPCIGGRSDFSKGGDGPSLNLVFKCVCVCVCVCVSTIIFGFQRGWGFYSQNAIFLPYFGKIVLIRQCPDGPQWACCFIFEHQRKDLLRAKAVIILNKGTI
jgi:hypothetical protein